MKSPEDDQTFGLQIGSFAWSSKEMMRSFLVGALFLGSCAARGDAGVSVRSSDGAANDAFDAARAAFEKGDASAFLRLKAFVKQFPVDAQRGEAEYLVGLIGAAREDFAAAARHFSAAAKSPAFAERARCFEGVTRFRAGDLPAAEMAFVEIRAKPSGGLQPGDGRRGLLERAILDAAKSLSTEKERAHWRATLPTGCVMVDGGSPLARATDAGANPDAGAVAAASMEKPVPKPKQLIGVLLPLSGRAKDLGERAQMGITQAGEELSKEPLYDKAFFEKWAPQAVAEQEKYKAAVSEKVASEPPPGIVFRDSGGKPEKARAAVRELVEKEGVVAIIGPMLAAESKAAAEEADKLGVPLVTLTPRHDITTIGKMSYRHFKTARHEAWAVARYAVHVDRRERIAVVHSDTNYGRSVARLFPDFVRDFQSLGGNEALRGKPVVAFSFASNATDHRALARALKAARVDAIYFPDAPKAAAPILPFLAKERLPFAATLKAKSRVRPLLLLGGDSWNSMDVVALGGNLVEGAVVATPFSPDGPDTFSTRFKSRWGVVSTHIERFAYGAYRLLHWAANRANARDAAGFVAALNSDPTSFPDDLVARTNCQHMHEPRGLDCPSSLVKVTNGQLISMGDNSP